MKAITLYQPWATLVAVGAKKIETRSWYTKYRGQLAIHAAKSYPKKLKALENWEPFKSALYPDNIYTYPCFSCGCIVAICNLVDCMLITSSHMVSMRMSIGIPLPSEPEFSFGDYTPGRYAWILEDIKRLPKPIPARGRQGIWEWDEFPEGVEPTT